jgi:uncharacterized protein (DUF169 family)
MKHQIEDYQAVGKKLKKDLELETELIAIKYVKKNTQIPKGFLRPLKDTGKKMTCCMAMAAARREKKKTLITPDDNPCTPISVGHGWARAGMLKMMKSQVDNKWNKDYLSVLRLNTARYRLGGFRAQWPLSRFMGHKGMMVAPLSETPYIPDTIVFFGYPLQILTAVHAFSYEGKYVPRGVAAGFGESCWSAALFPMKSKKPVFALGGYGCRAFGGTKNYEVILGIPGKLLFYIDAYLFKAGGEHNIGEIQKNPPHEVNEAILPGWQDIRDIMKY